MANSKDDIPSTMEGILIEATGGVDVLQYKTDLPVPQAREGEVLIKNDFVGVNYIDTYVRSGLYKADLPRITGREASGTVISSASSSSSSSSRFKPGDAVVYLGEATYAAYTCVPAEKLLTLPDGFSPQTAAASLLQGLTAVTLVHEAAGLRVSEAGTGPWAVVHAAAGGTGLLLVQVLAAAGARIIATAGSSAKLEIAKQHGAGWAVNNRSEDWVARVREITGGHGADVVFDGVGKATFEGDLAVIARKGTIVAFGNASGAIPPVDLLRLSGPNIRLMRPAVFGYLTTREELETYSSQLFELLAAGKVKINIHEVYPLKEVQRAHTDLESGKTSGKLLLQV